MSMAHRAGPERCRTAKFRETPADPSLRGRMIPVPSCSRHKGAICRPLARGEISSTGRSCRPSASSAARSCSPFQWPPGAINRRATMRCLDASAVRRSIASAGGGSGGSSSFLGATSSRSSGCVRIHGARWWSSGNSSSNGGAPSFAASAISGSSSDCELGCEFRLLPRAVVQCRRNPRYPLRGHRGSRSMVAVAEPACVRWSANTSALAVRAFRHDRLGPRRPSSDQPVRPARACRTSPRSWPAPFAFPTTRAQGSAPHRPRAESNAAQTPLVSRPSRPRPSARPRRRRRRPGAKRRARPSSRRSDDWRVPSCSCCA